jgi:uncharacterized membrane protein YccC
MPTSIPAATGNPAPAPGPARALVWLGATIKDWSSTEGERWLYVVKVMLSAFIALWLAYRLELDSPSTSLTTVLILALPSSGQVLEKSFYRLLGTVAGCIGAVTLTALFPQQAPLLFAGLAVWIGLCTCGAAMYRNWKSYGFVLAGYTACLITIPALDRPDAVFTVTLTRLTEVSLGILCSAFVNDAIFPRHQSARALQTVQSRYRSFVQFCDDVLEQRLSPADTEVTHLKFAADIAALESVRASAFFEARHVRTDTLHLNAFNTAFMAALTTFYTLHRLVHRLRAEPSIVLELSEPMFAAMGAALKEAPDAGALEAFRLQLAQKTAAARHRIDEEGMERLHQVDFETVVELLDRFTGNMEAFQSLYYGLTQQRRQRLADPQPYTPKTPQPIVVAAGVRAAFVAVLMGALWYELAWPYAAAAILMTVVFSALASSSPNPTGLIGQCLIGYFLALPLAFVSVFFIQVHAHGYPMLVLSMLPAFAIGTYLNGTPRFAGVGVGMNLFLSQTLVPANMLNLDATAFLNNSLALILGVMLAWVMFKIILPTHTMGQKGHVSATLWSETLATCEGRRRGLKHRFDNRMRDLLAQLNSAAGPVPDKATRAVVRQALTLLELGHSAIDMRELIATSAPGPARSALQDCIRQLAAYLRRPDLERCRQAIAAILEAGLQVRQAKLDATPERMARLQTALVDLHSIHTSLLDRLPVDAAAPSTAPGDPQHVA